MLLISIWKGSLLVFHRPRGMVACSVGCSGGKVEFSFFFFLTLFCFLLSFRLNVALNQANSIFRFFSSLVLR